MGVLLVIVSFRQALCKEDGKKRHERENYISKLLCSLAKLLCFPEKLSILSHYFQKLYGRKLYFSAFGNEAKSNAEV